MRGVNRCVDCSMGDQSGLSGGTGTLVLLCFARTHENQFDFVNDQTRIKGKVEKERV